MNRYAQGVTPVMVPQQFMAVPGAAAQLPPGMSGYNCQSAAQLPGVQQQQSSQSSHRGSSSNQDFRQRDDDRGGNRFSGRRPGNRWQSDAPVELDEPNFDESLVVLDHFNSDLHLVIDKDGYGGSVLNDPPGFCFTWAGARATYGVCRGKVFYEVHVVEHLPADFGDDHNETDPHVVRLGWSIDSSSFQLGEEAWSYGYGGTGKFSTNNRFTDYGGRFEEGDVIGAMVDLDSRPATVSFTKNGKWLGVATPLHGLPVGNKEKALFPHILSKNCRFKVNFGQMDAWYPPPMGFRYIGHLPLTERVRGMTPPARKSDCEMIMIVGLPGAGKTTWGINMEKNHPEKRYNIIGTDTLIEKMRVMGLPRKRNYHGRWEVLIDKATKCLNKLFTIAATRRRNYILDQTNVYFTARRRKMKPFAGFYRIAAVLQPDDPELERRSYKRTHEDGKFVPESAVLEMKANFCIPDDGDNLFDRIDFVELKRDDVQKLVRIYNDEGKNKPKDNSQSTFDSNRKPGDQRQQQYGSYKPQSYGQSSFDDKNFATRKREHGYYDQNESAVKRGRPDSGAYDTPKHQFAENERQPPTQQAPAAGRSAWSDTTQIKEEPGAFYPDSQWSSTGYTQDLTSSYSSTSRAGLPGAPQDLTSSYSSTARAGLLGAPQDLTSSYSSTSSRAGLLGAPQDLTSSYSSTSRAGLLGAPPTHGQNQYATTSQGYESQFDQDSSWQQPSAWQREPGKTSVRPQAQEPVASSDSWQTGWKGREDWQAATSRESGSRDLPFNQFEARDRDNGRGRDGDRDRFRDRDGETDRFADRERDRDRNWDRNSDYNRSNSDRGGYSGIDRSRQDVGYSGDDRSRQDGGYGGNDRSRQDAGYSGNDRSRQDAGYSSYDRTRQDAGYSSYNRTLQDGGYSSYDRTRQEVGYSSSDRSWQDEGYSSSDRARQDAAYGSSDRTRPGGAYSHDSAASSSWNDQSYASRSSSVRQNYDSDARKTDRQQEYKSQWGLPGQDRAAFSDQIKQEVDVEVFSSGQNMFSQSSEASRPAHLSSATLPGRHPGSSKSSKFDSDFPQAYPPLMGNIKTEFAAPFEDSKTPEVRKSSVGSRPPGQPGLKPLIPALEVKASDQPKARQIPAKENDSSQPKRGSSSTSSSGRPFPADSIEGRFTSGNVDKQPKPLAVPEDRKPDISAAPTSSGSTEGLSNLSKDEPGKPGLPAASDSFEADREPWNGPSYKPRGAPPMDDMESRRPPRGPPHYGSFGGPPHGFRGPGPWNQNNSRFGPQGPPRPFFSGPRGRWPRPPR